jgi:hypothetical protein
MDDPILRERQRCGDIVKRYTDPSRGLSSETVLTLAEIMMRIWLPEAEPLSSKIDSMGIIGPA